MSPILAVLRFRRVEDPERGRPRPPHAVPGPVFARALAWLDANFSVETNPGQGYRFVADVTVESDAAPAGPSLAASPNKHNLPAQLTDVDVHAAAVAGAGAGKGGSVNRDDGYVTHEQGADCIVPLIILRTADHTAIHGHVTGAQIVLVRFTPTEEVEALESLLNGTL